MTVNMRELGCLVLLCFVATSCGNGPGGWFGGDDKPGVNLTSPDGGETWMAGLQATVSWNTRGAVGDLKIELSTDGGTTWTTLIASTANDGEETVTVPATPSGQCVVRIIETGGGVSDVSNASFSISNVWHVDVDAAPGGDGLRWATALQHPQDAVDAALAGHEVWVTEGTYVRRSGSDTVVLTMKDGISVYGGFAGTEAARDQGDPVAHETILDGEDVAYHVVIGASNVTLDGFIITRGNASLVDVEHLGGGMYNLDLSELTIRRCRFTDNNAIHTAGAAWNDNVTDLTVQDCEFSDNTATYGGGGIVIAFSASVTVTDCTFTGNAAEHGGGMTVSQSTATITNCAFGQNIADGVGPGIGGGAIRCVANSMIQVVNCTFLGNDASDKGGAIYNYGGATTTVSNCILWGDSAPTGPEIETDGTSTCTVTYSDIQGGYAGTGNVDADPVFVDAGNGDLKLGPGSPCIDAADGDAATATDILGNPRHDDIDTPDSGTGVITHADMGAHEFQGDSGLVGGLVGWWKLDETTGVTAADSSGNNETGTLAGCTFDTSAAAGKIGGALDFDGIDDYVNVPDSPDLGGSSFTVACWAYHNGSTAMVLVDKWFGSNQFELYLDGSLNPRLAVRQTDDTGAGGAGTTVLNAGIWFHIAAVADTSTAEISIYVDGVKETLQGDPGWDGTVMSVAMPLNIGRKLSDQFYWNGLIDDVRVYERALRPAEIQALYQAAP